jgi:hypothetical protein
MGQNLIAVLAGLASAVLFFAAVSQSTLAVLLGFFASFPMFLIGLGWGFRASVISAVAGALLCLLAGGWLAAILFLAFTSIIPISITRLALLSRPDREVENGIAWYPEGDLLAWTATGTAAVLTVLLISATVYSSEDVQTLLRSSVEEIRPNIEKLLDQQGAAVSADRLIEWIADIIPAATAIYMLAAYVVNGLLAHALLTTRSRGAGRHRFSFISLEIPQWLTVVLAVLMILSIVGGPLRYISGSVAAVLFVPYFFLGLTVIHAMSRRWPARGIVLGLFYGILIILGSPVILVAGLGLADHLMGIKYRFLHPQPRE